MGTSELKSLLKSNCAVQRSRWRVWMDTQGEHTGVHGRIWLWAPAAFQDRDIISSGIQTGLIRVRGSSFLSLCKELKKHGKRSNLLINSTSSHSCQHSVAPVKWAFGDSRDWSFSCCLLPRFPVLTLVSVPFFSFCLHYIFSFLLYSSLVIFCPIPSFSPSLLSFHVHFSLVFHSVTMCSFPWSLTV